LDHRLLADEGKMRGPITGANEHQDADHAAVTQAGDAGVPLEDARLRRERLLAEGAAGGHGCLQGCPTRRRPYIPGAIRFGGEHLNRPDSLSGGCGPVYYLHMSILVGVLCQYPPVSIIGGVTPLRVRLKEERTKRGLSQLELAEKADVRQATISELETGKTRRLDFDVLERLAAALGVRATVLLVDDETDERDKKRGRK
jgi:DNA-binding Xre family transcriptional regulator